ncbi:MAG: peptidase U32 family protein, partial [Phycisphaerae bacterium]
MTSTLPHVSPVKPAASKIPELLAPAGDWDALKAAVANGADAVYFGLSNFNARHRATNFKTEELPAVMAYLHSHNVRGYLAFNTLIFSDELPDAVAYIQQIAAGGVDAVIVQDLGLARLIHRICPGLPIHGSTQMTLTEAGGIAFVNELVGGGVERVILARELSLPEIRTITEASPIPVEVFIHGALCIAYSGQCLTSESFGGRSANRGQCAQACRLPYELIVDGVPRDLGDKAYLLSPQDLAAHDLVLDLAQAGVMGIKIEGRLKSAHYVAATTQAYRQSLDAASHGERFSIAPEAKLNLELSFSRGFTHGFLGGTNHQELVAGRFPKARGTLVGTFAGLTPRGCLVKLTNISAQLKPGDGVVFDEGHPDQDEQGGRVFAVHQLNGARGPGVVEIELGHGDVQWATLASGAEPVLVWKTDDPAVRKRLEQSYNRDTIVRRRPLTARVKAHVGQPLEVTLEAEGHQATAIAPTPLAA